MKLKNRPYSIVSNQLWTLGIQHIWRLYERSSDRPTENSVQVMAEMIKIWKNRSGMRVIASSPDMSCAIFIDGTANGAILRITNETFIWQINLEDRKWIFGTQVVRLFELLKKLEESGANFTIG